MHRNELVAELFANGVVQINTAEGFLLASGKRSPLYLDHRRLFGIPGLREAALDLWEQTLRSHLLTSHRLKSAEADLPRLGCVGTATAGIAPGFGLALRLGVPFAYVRSSAKSHGLGQRIEGAPLDDRPLIVVDDMVTTGGSLLDACSALHEAQGRVVLATSFTSKHRLKQLGAAGPGQAAIDFVHVFSLRELLEAGRTLGVITGQQWETLGPWAQESGL